jgi:hypothetical protein
MSYNNCYKLLSQYTQNGLNPIVAPTPASTMPQLFQVYPGPHVFSQHGYQLHKSMYGTQEQPVNVCSTYATLGDIYSCGSSGTVTNSYATANFRPGFNEVSVSQFY